MWTRVISWVYHLVEARRCGHVQFFEFQMHLSNCGCHRLTPHKTPATERFLKVNRSYLVEARSNIIYYMNHVISALRFFNASEHLCFSFFEKVILNKTKHMNVFGLKSQFLESSIICLICPKETRSRVERAHAMFPGLHTLKLFGFPFSTRVSPSACPHLNRRGLSH